MRGGIATAAQLQAGVGPHRHVPGVIGFSAQARPGASADELATHGGIDHGPLPHGQISVTTVGAIRRLGFDVIATPGGGANHVTVVTSGPFDDSAANALSAIFRKRPNSARTP